MQPIDHTNRRLAILLPVGLLIALIILISVRMTRADQSANSPSQAGKSTVADASGVKEGQSRVGKATPPPSTTGVTYYVAPAGNDTNAGTSARTPWRTLAKVNQHRFQPGDRILLQRGGLWRETLIVPASGVASQPITIDAYGAGDAPIIDGADETRTPVRKIGIQLLNRQYVVVQNMTVKNASSRNIDITNDGTDGYNELRHLTVLNAAYPGIDLTDTGHNVIDGCEIAANGREGIMVEFTGDPHGVGFNTFSNNRIHDNPTSAGINLVGFSGTQRTVHNVVHDNEIYNNGDGIYLNYTDYSDIYRNIVHENNARAGDGEGDGIPHMSSSYNDVHDNTIYGQRRSGIEYWGGEPHDGHPYGRSDGNRAYRNHIYNNAHDDGAGIFLSSDYSNNTVIAYNLIEHNGSAQNNVGAGIWQPNVPDTGTMVLNNTIVANVPKQMRVKGAQTIIRNNVLSDPDYVVYSDDSYTVTGNLTFVDPNRGNFGIQSSATGIVVGVDLSDLPRDVQAIVNQDITGTLIQGKRTIGACGFKANRS